MNSLIYSSVPITQNTRSLARSYHDAGLNIIPLKTDGSKSAKIKWGKDETGERREYSWLYLSDWFLPSNPSGIGIVCGKTSDNLEVLDFDDCLSIFNHWQDFTGKPPTNLPIVQTPDNGRHVYYRCAIIEGNQTLASNKEGQARIELKGEGGMAVAPGSPLATHPTGRPYRLLQGDLTNIPTITPEVRQRFLDASRRFNAFEKPVKETFTGTTKKQDIKQNQLYELCGVTPELRPGEDFNLRAEWRDILEPKGWTLVTMRGDVGYWRKPNGKANTHHATTNDKGHDLFYNFSSSVERIETHTGYKKFTLFALLAFDNDYSKAAKHLAKLGYGKNLTER